MAVRTSEPTLQTYYSTLLGGLVGKRGVSYGRHGAVCLETHRFANASNLGGKLPTNILRPGHTYRQLTVHEFGTV